MVATCAGLEGIQGKPNCEPGPLSKSGTLRPDSACQRVQESPQHESRQTVWKSCWKGLGWACKLGEVGSQRITRVEQTVLPWLMETQIWRLPAGSAGGGLSKRSNSLCEYFCLGESCPSSPHPDARQFGSSLCMCTWHLYSWCPRGSGSVSE